MSGELTMRVACDGAWHRIRLVDGEMVLDDHPDVEAERVLAALGGARPACLERLDAWLDAIADGGFLDEWAGCDRIPTERVGWLMTALERTKSEGVQEYLHHVPLSRAARMGRFVVDFDAAWIDRAAVKVAARVVAGQPVACEQAPRLIRQAAALRLRRAFVASVAETTDTPRGFAALVPLRVTVGRGVAPSIAGVLAGRSSRVEITIDHGWLPHVWAPGTAQLDGHLVLALAGGVASTVCWTTGSTGDHTGLVPTIETRPVAAFASTNARPY